jgi:hypothetical protein
MAGVHEGTSPGKHVGPLDLALEPLHKTCRDRSREKIREMKGLIL